MRNENTKSCRRSLGGAIAEPIARTLFALAALLLAPLAVPPARAADEPAATAANSGNLLPNASFEERAADDVSGWQSRAWAGQADAKWGVDAPGRTGTHCLTIRSEKGADAAWTATVTVTSNTWYRLSGWIKTKDLKGAAGALLNIQNLQQVRTPPKTGTIDWTRVSTVFQSGDATVLEINCLFGGWGMATGQAWFDDVALEPVATNEALTATVTVGAAAEAKPYSPMIFGGFLEHFDHQVYGGVFEPGSTLSDARGFRKDVIAALKELKVPVIRWPGGCFVDAYHWRKGVGKKREPYGDFRWGVIEPNTFGTDEFVEFCRRIGAEPYICLNGLAPVQENLDWVAYCNATEGEFAEMRKANGYHAPFDVKFWSVGNERYDKAYIDRVRDTTKAMKALYPKVQTTCAGAQDGSVINRSLIEQTGDYLDYVSIHSYGLQRADDLPKYDYLSAIMKSEEPEAFIDRVSKSLKAAGSGDRIKIAYDEWNLRAWQHPGFPRDQVENYDAPAIRELVERRRQQNDVASQYTMADALFSASFFNACLRHADEVGMANIAPLVNTRGPLFVHPKGIVKRTHFHTMAMYANELHPRVGKLDLTADELCRGGQSIPVADAVVTVDDSGKNWAIALVNRHPELEVACTVTMQDPIPDGSHEAIVLAGDSPDSYNDIEHPERVVPRRTTLVFANGVVHLPPHSLSIVRLTMASQLRTSFSAREYHRP
jgi:alpha-N-arabinofuranosidase